MFWRRKKEKAVETPPVSPKPQFPQFVYLGDSPMKLFGVWFEPDKPTTVKDERAIQKLLNNNHFERVH